MTYKKIGGIHWLAIGRLRFNFCITRRKPVLIPTNWLPIDLATLRPLLDRHSMAFLYANQLPASLNHSWSQW